MIYVLFLFQIFSFDRSVTIPFETYSGVAKSNKDFVVIGEGSQMSFFVYKIQDDKWSNYKIADGSGPFEVEMLDQWTLTHTNEIIVFDHKKLKQVVRNLDNGNISEDKIPLVGIHSPVSTFWDSTHNLMYFIDLNARNNSLIHYYNPYSLKVGSYPELKNPIGIINHAVFFIGNLVLTEDGNLKLMSEFFSTIFTFNNHSEIYKEFTSSKFQNEIESGLSETNLYIDPSIPQRVDFVSTGYTTGTYRNTLLEIFSGRGILFEENNVTIQKNEFAVRIDGNSNLIKKYKLDSEIRSISLVSDRLIVYMADAKTIVLYTLEF